MRVINSGTPELLQFDHHHFGIKTMSIKLVAKKPRRGRYSDTFIMNLPTFDHSLISYIKEKLFYSCHPVYFPANHMSLQLQTLLSLIFIKAWFLRVKSLAQHSPVKVTLQFNGILALINDLSRKSGICYHK